MFLASILVPEKKKINVFDISVPPPCHHHLVPKARFGNSRRTRKIIIPNKEARPFQRANHVDCRAVLQRCGGQSTRHYLCRCRS